MLVIIGIMLGAVSFGTMQSSHQRLLTDAKRIGLLLQIVREEAIVRNRPTAFEADEYRYRFLVRNDNKWEQIQDLDLLREREFVLSPIKISMIPNTQVDTNELRIIFGREPVDKPFVLELSVGEDHVAVHADGVGHFVAE